MFGEIREINTDDLAELFACSQEELVALVRVQHGIIHNQLLKLAELDSLRDATRWRSVEEELPHRANVVLAWSTHLGPYDTPFKAFHDLDQWWTDEGDPVGVDYWQPLPEPPQEEE